VSYDRQLDQICTHIVVEEALFLSADRQTVRPLRPIAAISSVKVRANGEILVPSYGTHIPAQATGTRAGPFNIQGGTNDKLVLKIGDGAFQTLTLPSGNQMPAARIADALNQQVREAVFSSTAKRQLRIKTSLWGPATTILIRATGSTAAGVLGLATNRTWRGQTTTPGWSIVNDPNTLADRPTRLLVFDTPLKGYQDYVELDYSTVREECRRCGGVGIENDWRYNGQGKVITVENENLLLQEMTKILYTIQGSNPFNPLYGTRIVDSIGKKLSSGGLVQNMIVSDINEAFRRWQYVKDQQEKFVGQVVSDEEYPFRILSVTLQQSEQDPTIIFVNATVQNRSNKPIQIERGIRTPMPLDLLGSTQQQSTFNATLPNYSLVE
jgi:phage baseplate assembly protein W